MSFCKKFSTILWKPSSHYCVQLDQPVDPIQRQINPVWILNSYINPLTPNDPYRGRSAPLISKRFILYIYSTNIGTEYFKLGIYSPFFFFKMQFVS